MRSSLCWAFIAVLLSTAAIAAGTEEQRKLDAWRKSMARVSPAKKGCFKAVYPGTAWQEIPCAKPPDRFFGPNPGPVGHGIDFEAQTAGLMSSATGSFDAVNVASEINNGNPDTYSLQLNSSYFVSPVCSGAANPNNCKGWQQFIYSSGLGTAFIEYWLIYYENPCPAGWSQISIHCVKNSAAILVGPQPIANLKQLTLTGTAAAGGIDTLVMGIPGNTLNAMFQDDVLSLAGGWNKAEFGIFGDGGGSAADFNAGATMAVRTSVIDGSMNAPTCVLESFTSETNNLNLVPPCCAFGGANPAIVFWLSNNPGATSMCSGGTSIGDTHLTNFNDLYYDFQASGDFLLAETDPTFSVQTRQKSGAPTWPNASVNKAVAMTLGPTRAAVCLDPTRLVVDGRPRDVQDGESIILPSGVHIAHGGSTYLFTRPSGESVSAQVNPGWINVSVGLDHLPQARVYGLLGNFNGDQGEDDLARRDRVVLAHPLSFNDLYHPYADSWRLSPRESLLSRFCGETVETGIPQMPFYAENLDPNVSRRARAICTDAGVRDATLLDACTLDTAVLGEAAARVYVRAQPPRTEVRVTSPPR